MVAYILPVTIGIMYTPAENRSLFGFFKVGMRVVIYEVSDSKVVINCLEFKGNREVIDMYYNSSGGRNLDSIVR